MSLIHAFPIEDMYPHEFPNSFQHTGSFQQTAREDSLVEVAAPPPKSKLTRGRQNMTVQYEDAPRQTAWANEEEIMLCKGVNLLTSASGSQPQGNTKKNRIQRTQSRVTKNKLEDHPRIDRPSLHNKKSVVNTKAISSVPNSKLNVNSDLKCATCNGCLFSDNHDSCVLAFINSVNARVKSKSAKKPVNRKFWQPT
uniref:Uncharacterized protein n=1 Tax=Tanacetum cinerariifolium TaxID=118510 RepID=A0A6L2KA48_TANCI|nr:hypothetical protein [Tanacetum cinerariifolium]